MPLLADHFLRIFCAAAKKPLKTMQHDVLEILEDYPWPGNVRELENVIQRLVLMNNSPTITADTCLSRCCMPARPARKPF